MSAGGPRAPEDEWRVRTASRAAGDKRFEDEPPEVSAVEHFSAGKDKANPRRRRKETRKVTNSDSCTESKVDTETVDRSKSRFRDGLTTRTHLPAGPERGEGRTQAEARRGQHQCKHPLCRPSHRQRRYRHLCLTTQKFLLWINTRQQPHLRLACGGKCEHNNRSHGKKWTHVKSSPRKKLSAKPRPQYKMGLHGS